MLCWKMAISSVAALWIADKNWEMDVFEEILN
jgi:hypothetical protein